MNENIIDYLHNYKSVVNLFSDFQRGRIFHFVLKRKIIQRQYFFPEKKMLLAY